MAGTFAENCNAIHRRVALLHCRRIKQLIDGYVASTGSQPVDGFVSAKHIVDFYATHHLLMTPEQGSKMKNLFARAINELTPNETWIALHSKWNDPDWQELVKAGFFSAYFINKAPRVWSEHAITLPQVIMGSPKAEFCWRKLDLAQVDCEPVVSAWENNPERLVIPFDAAALSGGYACEFMNIFEMVQEINNIIIDPIADIISFGFRKPIPSAKDAVNIAIRLCSLDKLIAFDIDTPEVLEAIEMENEFRHDGRIVVKPISLCLGNKSPDSDYEMDYDALLATRSVELVYSDLYNFAPKLKDIIPLISTFQ